ncbi:MAG TPA: superoxide dismutase family protein [Thermoanaerobaculia bacterium]
MNRTMAAALAASLVIGCGGENDTDLGELEQDSLVEQPAPDAATANGRATLTDAQGREVGTATLAPANGGLGIEVRVAGIAPGDHGIHVHTVGQCDAASAFESAGAHLNPAGAQHGLDNPAGPHMGDLPNLTVGADSAGTLTQATPIAADSLFDADGSALVIHAQRDDQRTDPSGDSGDRIACGVIERAG